MEKTKEKLIKESAVINNLIEAANEIVKHTDLLSKEKIVGIKKEIKILEQKKTILEGELMCKLNKEYI